MIFPFRLLLLEKGVKVFFLNSLFRKHLHLYTLHNKKQGGSGDGILYMYLKFSDRFIY